MIEVKQGIYNNKTITTMGNEAAMSVSEGPAQISDYRYKRAIDHITLLRAMGEISNAEVKRLLSLLKSPDSENWHIAELAIEEKLS